MTDSKMLSRVPRWSSRALSLLTLTAVLGACSRGKAADTPDAERAAMAVNAENVVLVEAGEIRSGPALSGTLQPKNQATLRAEVPGAVVRVYAEEGERVSAGQVLARIDDAALRESWLSARSGMRSAEENAILARRNAERATRLSEAGAIAERDLEGSRLSSQSAEAALADAKARLTNAERMLAKTEIRAPFAGVVSARPVNSGDVVQAGTALVTVVDPSRLEIEANVPAEAIAYLTTGKPVDFTVSGYGDRAFTGVVERISPTLDPATRQVKVRVSIVNPGQALVGGLFARGRIATERHEGLSAPFLAVEKRGGADLVVRLRNGTVEHVPVELGLRDDQKERVEIRSGLADGDTLLVGAARTIAPGTPVRVIRLADRPIANR